MKHLVVYSSQTGNTKKLAESIFTRLTEEKDIKPVEEAPDPVGYDAVAVGFWFQGGLPDLASLEYLKKCKNIPKLFLFATHGATNNSEDVTLGMNKAIELTTGSNIVGKFNCQGEVSEKVIESARNMEPQPTWLKNVTTAKGHPNNEDLYALSEALEKAQLVEIPKKKEKRMFS